MSGAAWPVLGFTNWCMARIVSEKDLLVFL